MKTVEPIRDNKTIKNMRAILKSQSTRNELLFILGINVGLRISDILKLKVRDLTKSYTKAQKIMLLSLKSKQEKSKILYW